MQKIGRLEELEEMLKYFKTLSLKKAEGEV